MSYPSGLKIFIDGKDCTYYIFGSNTFDPTIDRNTFRDIDITPYLRKQVNLNKSRERGLKRESSDPTLHTIEVTAADGNGRVECRVEVR